MKNLGSKKKIAMYSLYLGKKEYPFFRTHNAPISRFSPNAKTCPKSKDNENFGHPLTLGASRDASFVMSADKSAIFGWPNLAFLPPVR